MIRRPARLLLPLAFLIGLAGCATSRPPARHFAPAGEDEARSALDAFAAAQQRAASLGASRLLYDARIGSKGTPAVPGTLAVTYDGAEVRRASLTGPFGSRVAEYAAGTVTGKDRQALLVEPGLLTAVLAGNWPGAPSKVEGCDADACLLVWESKRSVSAVIDRRSQRLLSLAIVEASSRIDVSYEGRIEPWPEHITAREEPSGRGLKLTLEAVEAADASPNSARR